MSLRAGLAMYARPELDAANAALWAGIRDRLTAQGVAAPKALSRNGAGYGFWSASDMLLSQTCGYPYRAHLRGKVALVGTPDFGLPGCRPGYYRSVFVMRAGPAQTGIDPKARFAFNSTDSQSGYVGPLAYARAQGLALRPDVETGSHRASGQAVADGRADLAALDAITWGFMQEFDDFAQALTVVAETDPVPGLPLITGQEGMVEVLQEAVAKTIADPAPEARLLGIKGLCLWPDDAYADHFFAQTGVAD